MSEQEQEQLANLGALVQEHGSVKLNVDELAKSLHDAGEVFRELADALTASGGPDAAKAQEALEKLPPDLTASRIREMVLLHQEASARLAAIQARLKPYGLLP